MLESTTTSEHSPGIAALTYRLSERALNSLRQRPKVKDQVEAILRAKAITNKDAFVRIGDLLNWEDDPELKREQCLPDRGGYTLAEGIITQLRKHFLNPDEIESRYQFTNEALNLIQTALDNPDFRGRLNARNYEKMVAWLIEQDPMSFGTLTPNSLKVAINNWKAESRLTENILWGALNEEDLPLLRNALADESFYLPSGGLNYQKVQQLLDPNGTRGLSEESISQYIRFHLADVPRAINYAERRLNDADVPVIQAMLDDQTRKYYLPSGVRDYASMILELDPQDKRGITRENLTNYIAAKKKIGALHEERQHG